MTVTTKARNASDVELIAEENPQDPPYSECPECGVLLTEVEHNLMGVEDMCENSGKLHGDLKILSGYRNAYHNGEDIRGS